MRAWTLAMIVTLALAGSAAAGPADPFDPFHEAGVDRRPDARFPMDLSFRDAQGRVTTLAALGHGEPIVLVPVQHHCPNICGFTLKGLTRAIGGQGFKPGSDFQVVAFGIDPKETPADARTSADRLRAGLPGGAASGVHALVGAPADVARAMRGIGYRYGWDARIGQYAHIAAMAVLTPDGRPARWLYGVAPQPGDLRLALTEAGQGRIGGLGDQLLLLCYHYDPHTGRYSSLVWLLLRGAAVATVLGLLGFIGLAMLRERRRRGAGA